MDEDEKLVMEFCLGGQKLTSIDSRRFAELYKMAYLNKIEQYFIEEICLRKDTFKNHVNIILSRIDEEKKKRTFYEKKLYEILTFLENVEIRAIPIKSIFPFPYVDTDLDILIIDDDFKPLKKQIAELGYKEYNSPKREPFKHFFAKDGDKWPLIHIHRQLSWNGMIFLDKNEAWEKASIHDTPYGQIKKPSNAFDVLIASAHCMFENFFITGNDIILFLAVKNDINWKQIKGQAVKFGWPTALIIYLNMINSYSQRILNKKLVREEIINSLYNEALFFEGRRELKPIVLPKMVEKKYILLPIIEKLFKDLSQKKTSALTRKLIFLFGLNYLLYKKNYQKIDEYG